MTDKKIIAVVGATGAQGGGLVRAILADPDGPFTARALTRNADSDRARALGNAAVRPRDRKSLLCCRPGAVGISPERP